MEEKLTKEFAKKLMEIGGEVRGVVFKTDAEFVLERKGKEGLKKLEKELEKMGFPVDYEKIKIMDFYPIGLRAISLLAIQKTLDLSREDIKEMGARAPKISLIIKLFMKYFLSIKKTAEQVPRMWKKHYTVGKLEVETNEEKRYVILRLKGLALCPAFCHYLEGYFSTVLKMVVGALVVSKETKCTFEGDNFHEFLLKWQ